MVSDEHSRPRAAFFRLSSRPIPRVARAMAVADEAGYDCTFVGARREADLPSKDLWEGMHIERIGRPFPLLNGTRPITYAWGVLSYWTAMASYLLRARPTLIHISDFEIGVFGVLAGRLLGARVVYNIHDNLAERYRVGAMVRRMLAILEGCVVLLANRTMVPEPFRKDLLPRWSRSRVVVARNSPGDPGRSAPVGPRRPPVVLFAGWLDWGRGLRELLALARGGQISLVLAGDGDPDIRRVAEGTPNTQYLGFIGHAQIIRLTAEADYVAAFYDPARPINRYAASNKIAEALAVGRPVLTNTEVMVSKSLLSAGSAIVLPYAELPRLGELLAKVDLSAEYNQLCAAARRQFLDEYHPSAVAAATRAALLGPGLVPANQ